MIAERDESDEEAPAVAAPRVALPDAPAHAVVPPAPPASEGAPRAARHAAYPAVVRPPPSMAPGAMSSIEAAARRAAGGLRYGAAAGEAPPAADQVPPHGRAQAVPPPSAQEVPPPRELDAAQLAMLAPRGAAVIEADAAPLYGDVRPASGGAAADGVDDYPGGAGAVGAPAAYPVAVGPVRAHPVHASDAAADSARAAIDAAEARAAAAADGRAVVAHDAESLSLEDISAQFAEAVRLAGSVLFGGQGKVEEDEDVDGEGAEVLAPAPDDIKLLSLPEWEDDGGGVFGRYDVRCKVCKKTFGLLTSHKHHCRNCGALVCSKCSRARWPKKMLSPAFNLKNEKMLRICTVCQVSLEKFRGALMDGNLERALRVFRRGYIRDLSCPQMIFEDRSYAVHCAVHGGSIEAVEWLVEMMGCRIDSKDGLGRTPLEAAAVDMTAGSNRFAIFRYLMERGADASEIRQLAVAQCVITAAVLGRLPDMAASGGESTQIDAALMNASLLAEPAMRGEDAGGHQGGADGGDGGGGALIMAAGGAGGPGEPARDYPIPLYSAPDGPRQMPPPIVRHDAPYPRGHPPGAGPSAPPSYESVASLPPSGASGGGGSSGSADDDVARDSECVVCFEREINVVLVPCGHYCCCSVCADAMGNEACPVCRAPVEKVVRTYRT